MKIDREAVKKEFVSYVSAYDRTDIKILLKEEHTERVAGLCEQIAESLRLSTEDTDLAWLLGMLHDIGRFEQLRRFGTFADAKSVNHAALSADILFQEGMIHRFVQQESEDIVMQKAIRLHNVYELPQMESVREKMFCDILRDADKIDILKVNCDIPMSEIYDEPEEAFYEADISEAVLADVLACRNVNRAHTRTAIDHLIGHISLTFGLVYPESLRIISRQGYLDQMLSFESRNPHARDKMKLIRETVDDYLRSRMAE